MAIMHINSRQYVRVALAEIDAEFTNGSTFQLPPGTIVLTGGYNILEAASGTLPTLTLVDNQDTPLSYMTAVDFATVADAAITAGDRQYYPAGATFTFSTGGTNPAGGRALVWLEYIDVETQDELYGRSA